MKIFDIFKSKKRKEYEYLCSILHVSTNILEIIKKKKKFLDTNIIDMDFETNMRDEMLVFSYNKYGALNFLDEKFRQTILRIISSTDFDENYKKDVFHLYHYLNGFTRGIKQLVDEKEKNL